MPAAKCTLRDRSSPSVTYAARLPAATHAKANVVETTRGRNRSTNIGCASNARRASKGHLAGDVVDRGFVAECCPDQPLALALRDPVDAVRAKVGTHPCDRLRRFQRPVPRTVRIPYGQLERRRHHRAGVTPATTSELLAVRPPRLVLAKSAARNHFPTSVRGPRCHRLNHTAYSMSPPPPVPHLPSYS